MNILFISRAYPPIVGGIENHNYELSSWLSKKATVTTIANQRGKKFLPFFLPYALIRALWLVKKYDVILLGDGVLGIIGYIVKKVSSNTKVVSVVHGLDLTYSLAFYQYWWVGVFLPKLDTLIAVGNETIRVGNALGIPSSKFVFIPNGVDTEKHFLPYLSDQDYKLSAIIGESVQGKNVLLTSGRLARRKGVAWFIRFVLPALPPDIRYVVAGDGADKKHILSAIQETHAENRVKLLGYVNDETRNILFNTCALFIQPNIRVKNDMEGFGISVIEAASCQIPVIASRLEGLQDAIQDGESGFLIESENAQAYTAKIIELLNDDTLRKEAGIRARQYVIDHFHWDSIATRYIQTLETVCHSTQNQDSH